MVYGYDEEYGLIKVDTDTIYLTKAENIIFKELYYTGFPVSAEKLNDKLNYRLYVQREYYQQYRQQIT